MAMCCSKQTDNDNSNKESKTDRWLQKHTRESTTQTKEVSLEKDTARQKKSEDSIEVAKEMGVRVKIHDRGSSMGKGKEDYGSSEEEESSLLCLE